MCAYVRTQVCVGRCGGWWKIKRLPSSVRNARFPLDIYRRYQGVKPLNKRAVAVGAGLGHRVYFASANSRKLPDEQRRIAHTQTRDLLAILLSSSQLCILPVAPRPSNKAHSDKKGYRLLNPAHKLTLATRRRRPLQNRHSISYGERRGALMVVAPIVCSSFKDTPKTAKTER